MALRLDLLNFIYCLQYKIDIFTNYDIGNRGAHDPDVTHFWREMITTLGIYDKVSKSC